MTSVICVIVFDELFSNQHLLLVSFISLWGIYTSHNLWCLWFDWPY